MFYPSPLILTYIAYVITMTLALSWAFDESIRGNNLGSIAMIISYISTSVYLIFFSLNNIGIVLPIVVIFIVIPITLRNLGLNISYNISLLLVNEIIMSLVYYVILRGFNNAILALSFYGTDIPVSFLSPVNVVLALIELSNSFMFLLMILPEILYFSIRRKYYYPLMLSILALSGPNIASEMTHSILPLPYDPIKESSILITLLSLILSVYFSYKVVKGRMNLNNYLIFIMADIILSLSSLYYSISLNEIPYGIATLITIYIALSDIKLSLRIPTTIWPLLAIPQALWGLSIALWYNLLQFELLLGIGLSIFYIISVSLITKF
jgi:hypothetical protein